MMEGGWELFCAGRIAAELDTWFRGLGPLFLFVLDSSPSLFP